MTEFHQHINSVCHHVQFTMEEEQDLSLPFLDVLVIRHDKTLHTQVYRKPTHTDKYLHFDSHHPQHQKLAVTKTLHDRANTQHHPSRCTTRRHLCSFCSTTQRFPSPALLPHPQGPTTEHNTAS